VVHPSDNGLVGYAPAAAGGLAVLNPPTDQSFHAGESLSFRLPSATFVDSSADASLSVSVRLANGQPLPSWLHFDPSTGSFQGTPPPGFQGEVNIVVTARDSQGHEASTTFKLKVAAGQPSSHLERGQPIFALGRPSLADQFARHGTPLAQSQRSALLEHAARAARLRAG
jgi:hypothetical protein